MTKKLISFKDYRANLSKIWKDAKLNNIIYVVLIHSKPAFEVKPITSKVNLEDNNTPGESFDDFKQYILPMKGKKVNISENIDSIIY